MRLVLPRKKMNNYEADVNVKNNRLLITVNVVGSSGPLRFLVNEDDKVSNVIDLSLKLYARGGRLPILGSDIKDFMLYASDAGSGGGNSTSFPCIYSKYIVYVLKISVDDGSKIHGSFVDSIILCVKTSLFFHCSIELK